MAKESDHQLVGELMDSVRTHHADRAAPPRKNVRPPRSRGILDIVFWSSLTNLTLLACFVAGWNFDVIKRYVTNETMPASVSSQRDDQLAESRSELADNELLTRGLQRQLKGSLQFTVVPSSAPAVVEDAPESEFASVDAETPEQDQGDGFGDVTVGPEDPAAQLTRSPVLRKSKTKGEIEIGSFTTVSLPGSSAECLDTAYGLLDDAGASRDKLKVLADSNAITVARICADNGSLVVTCRMDQITISPRRLKPNETCTG
jgi:hypothetical protein